MFSRTRILLGAAAVAVALAAWEYVRVEAHPKFTPETMPGAAPQQSDAPPAPLPVQLNSPLAGTVSAVYVSANTFVKTGQALALIDSPVLRARLDEAQADLEMERSAAMNAETAAENLQAQLSNAQTYMLDVEAQVSGAEAMEADARSVFEHRDELYRAGVLAREARDLADRDHATSQNAVEAAQARLNEVSHLVDDARRSEEAAASKAQQAKAEVERCEQALAEAQSVNGTRWILAPIDGT